MEYIRTITITIEVDTNKETHRATFESMDEAIAWYKDLLKDF